MRALWSSSANRRREDHRRGSARFRGALPAPAPRSNADVFWPVILRFPVAEEAGFGGPERGVVSGGVGEILVVDQPVGNQTEREGSANRLRRLRRHRRKGEEPAARSPSHGAVAVFRSLHSRGRRQSPPPHTFGPPSQIDTRAPIAGAIASAGPRLMRRRRHTPGHRARAASRLTSTGWKPYRAIMSSRVPLRRASAAAACIRVPILLRRPSGARADIAGRL